MGVGPFWHFLTCFIMETIRARSNLIRNLRKKLKILELASYKILLHKESFTRNMKFIKIGRNINASQKTTGQHCSQTKKMLIILDSGRKLDQNNNNRNIWYFDTPYLGMVRAMQNLLAYPTVIFQMY